MRKLLVLFAILGLFSCQKELGGDDAPINIPLTTTLTGTINTTTTLTADKVWTLKGYVYVTMVLNLSFNLAQQSFLI